MSSINRKSGGGSTDAAAAAREAAKKAAAEAAKKAAEKARAEAAAKAAAAAAAKAAAAAAAKQKSEFKAGAAGISAGAAAAAKLEPVAAHAKAELGKVAGTFAKASGVLQASAPTVAGLAAGIGAEAKKLSEEPSRAFGPFSFDVGALADRAKSVFDTVKDTAGKGVELLKEGTDHLRSIAGGLDTAKEHAIDEIRKQTVDPSIDGLNSEGDSVKINLAGELLVPTPIPSLKGKGTADMAAEIKRDEDGGYTISTEGNAMLGASVGVEDPAAGNSASGDLLVGGGGKVEFKVKPVLDKNGNVDEVATKAKAKELTEALARQAIVAGSGAAQPLANAVVGPTPDQLKLIQESFAGMELKGSAALALAAKLNLPGVATLDLGGKVQQDLTIRIERGEKGLAISMKNTVSGELEAQAAGPLGVINGGGKGTAKVELEQKFEFPGINNLQDVIKKGSSVKPEVKQTLTLSTDGQVGVGTGLSGETGVADGKLRDQVRLGATTELKIDVTGKPEVIRDIASEAIKGNLPGAAKKAGDNIDIQLKTTIYTERSRLAGGNLKNESVGGLGAKGELVERDVVLAPKPVKTNATQVAAEMQRQLEELQRRQQEQTRNPIVMRG